MQHLILAVFAATLSFLHAKPNLLFINVDDMNTDSIGAYGCPIPDITPHIDKLAAGGITFEKAHVNISICQPSRSVWLTGRYPHRSGGLGFHNIDDDCPSLPEALKQGGYYNAVIGKVIHIIPTRHHAFDYVRDQKDLGMGRSPSEYADAIRTSIANAKQAGKPFFIMASLHDPHRPFADSQGDYKNLPPVTRTITPEEAVVPPFLPDLPEIRKEIAQYFTSVHRADEVTGAILAEIEKAGLADDTLVVFMSDNGIPVPFAKSNCYLASTSTPCIIRFPGHAKPGSRDSAHLVAGIDLTPTLLDAAGLPPLPGVDGSSILPLIRGETLPHRDMAFTSINTIYGEKAYPMRAVVTHTHLYIWNAWSDGSTTFRNESMSGLTFKAMQTAAENDPAIAKRVSHLLHRTPHELYHIAEDPHCLHNLLENPTPEATATARRLAATLKAQMEQTQDPQLPHFREN